MNYLARLSESNVVAGVIVIGPGFVEDCPEPESLESHLEHCAQALCRTTDRFVLTGEAAPQRKNFASIGYVYDAINDVFIPPSPSPDFVWDLDSNSWIPPLPMPVDGLWAWDSSNGQWVALDPPN